LQIQVKASIYFPSFLIWLKFCEETIGPFHPHKNFKYITTRLNLTLMVSFSTNILNN